MRGNQNSSIVVLKVKVSTLVCLDTQFLPQLIFEHVFLLGFPSISDLSRTSISHDIHTTIKKFNSDIYKPLSRVYCAWGEKSA
jgi:hypothetical protein